MQNLLDTPCSAFYFILFPTEILKLCAMDSVSGYTVQFLSGIRM